MKRPPDVSDEQVRSYMDFDRLLHQRNMVLQRRNTMIKTAAVVFSVAAILTLFYFYSRQPDQQKDLSPLTDSQTVPTDSAASGTTREWVAESPIPDSMHETGPMSQIPTDGNAPSDKESKAETMVKEETASKRGEKQNYDPASRQEAVYVQAEPVAGYDDLFNYFRKNLRYPSEAMQDSIQGIMTISFVINTLGDAENIEVVKSLGEAFDKEAILLIGNMPEWRPATLNGKPVKSKLSLPLTFELKKIESN